MKDRRAADQWLNGRRSIISHKLFDPLNPSKQRPGKWDPGGVPALGVLRTGPTSSIVLGDRLGMALLIPFSAFEQAKDRHFLGMASR
jgi:hypothetical protein